MLEVVQDQENLPAPDPVHEDLRHRAAALGADAERVGDRAGYQAGFRERREVDERRDRSRQPARHLESEPGLADPAGSEQGDEPGRWIAQQLEHGVDLPVATDDGRRGNRQRRGHQAALRRVGGRVETFGEQHREVVGDQPAELVGVQVGRRRDAGRRPDALDEVGEPLITLGRGRLDVQQLRLVPGEQVLVLSPETSLPGATQP